jgi:hypothetical protein
MDRFSPDTNNARAAQQQALNIAEFMLRGSAHMVKLQNAAARALLATHGRTAAMLGGPDWSAAFNGPGSEQLEALLDTGTEQAVRVLRTTNDTVQQVQQQFATLVEQQARMLTDQLRSSIEEMTRRSRDSVERFGRLSEEGVQHVQQAGLDAQRSGFPTQQIITPGS